METEIISPALAGFKMLIMMSQVDGFVANEEKTVIQKYLLEKFPIQSIDDDFHEVKEIHEDEFLLYAMDFYQTSTEEERTQFLQFAFDLIKADAKITKEENTYINLLYDVWQLDDRT